MTVRDNGSVPSNEQPLAGFRIGVTAARRAEEQINLLENSDALLINSLSLEAMQAQPTFTSLPAVQAGHLFASDYFFPSSYGISSALLADIEAGLKEL